MNGIFYPAVRLMAVLRFPRKFALLGLVALIAIGVLQTMLYRYLNGVIEPARLELDGLRTIKPLTGLIQSMQQHRGLSSGVINGNEAMKERRANKAGEIGKQIDAVESRLSAAQKQHKAWTDAKALWAQLESSGLSLTAPENFKLHTRLVALLLRLEVQVADDSTLTLDPDLDSYYLMDAIIVRMPQALERLGQLRAKGTGLLTRKEISDLQKVEVGTLVAELEFSQANLTDNLNKVMAISPFYAAKLKGGVDAFSAAAEGIAGLIRDEVISGRMQQDPKAYFDATTKVIDQGYVLMSDTLSPALEEVIRQRMESGQRDMVVSLGLAVAMTLVFAYLAMGAYLNIVSSVERVSESAERLARGELSVQTTVDTQDELHTVGLAFNRMASSFASAVGDVQRNAVRVADAARRLSSVTNQLCASAEEQSGAATRMAASVEEVSNSIDQISHQAHDVREISAQSGQVAKEGRGIVLATADEVSLVAETVNRSASIVEELGAHSEGISSIVSTIREIAEQTNLLALNAAIEAARAGETGRGFAVVADEVRKLAERTALSTQEITERITSIQHGTSGAVLSMKEGVDQVAKGVAMAKDAGESIGQVSEGSERVMESIRDISSALSEQVALSNAITEDISRVARMAEDNHSATIESAQTAQELEQLARALQDDVARFRL